MTWRTIDSAPKDGTVIIVSGGIAYWRDGEWYTLTAEPWPGKSIEWEVTHWMPLQYYPPRPAQKE